MGCCKGYSNKVTIGYILSSLVFLDYNVTAKMVTRSSGRALGLLVERQKLMEECFVNVLPNCMTLSFNLY